MLATWSSIRTNSSFRFVDISARRFGEASVHSAGVIANSASSIWTSLTDETIPDWYEVEVVEALQALLADLALKAPIVKVNHREFMNDVLTAIGVADPSGALRAIDKLRKVGVQGVAADLRDLGESETVISHLPRIATVRTTDMAVISQLQAELGIEAKEYNVVLSGILGLNEGGSVPCEIDLSVARGLDYYTGTVIEAYLSSDDALGAVASGGRYDNLAETVGASRSMPGVGISVGISRVMSFLQAEGMLDSARVRATDAIIVARNEAITGAHLMFAARWLRKAGISAEVTHRVGRLDRQLTAPRRRGTRFALELLDAEDHVKWWTLESESSDAEEGTLAEAAGALAVALSDGGSRSAIRESGVRHSD